MLGFFWNLGPIEIGVALILSVLIFGRRLPQVAGQGMRHAARARRYLEDLRRESGIDRELHDVRRTFSDAAREVRVEKSQSRPYPRRPEVEDRREPEPEPDDAAEGSAGDAGTPPATGGASPEPEPRGREERGG